MRRVLKRTGIGCGGLFGLLIVLAILGALAGPRPAATPSLSPTVAAVATPTAAPVAKTVATSALPPPATSQPSAVTDTRLTGQTRYIANTEGLGIKVRSACDDQAGAGGWAEGTAVIVEYARADCSEWLLVKRSDADWSWVRVSYLSEAPPVVAAAPTVTTAPPTGAPTAAPPTPAPPAATRAPPTQAPAPTATPAPAKPAAPTPTLTLAQRSPEEQLAVIQHGAMLRPEDPRVRAFAEVLDRMEAKCSEDRQTLADRLAGANKVMADRGVREPMLDTARGVATATEGLPSEQPCQDVIVAYATIRVGGAPGTRGR